MYLKINDTYFEGKKQVGEQVEKSPEPKKYQLYKTFKHLYLDIDLILLAPPKKSTTVITKVNIYIIYSILPKLSELTKAL